MVIRLGFKVQHHAGFKVERSANDFKAGRIRPAQAQGVLALCVVSNSDVGHQDARGGAGVFRDTVVGEHAAQGQAGGVVGNVCNGSSRCAADTLSGAKCIGVAGHYGDGLADLVCP